VVETTTRASLPTASLPTAFGLIRAGARRKALGMGIGVAAPPETGCRTSWTPSFAISCTIKSLPLGSGATASPGAIRRHLRRSSQDHAGLRRLRRQRR
jgi:hypothetical protein